MNNHPGSINQVNSGFMAGGMQAAVGNNNTQIAPSNGSPAADIVTKNEAIELIAQIKQIIQNLDVSEPVKENSIKYLDIAKIETEEEEPNKELVAKSLERVAKNIDSLEKTLDSSQHIMKTVSPMLLKIAGWLGAAAGSLWTLLG
ncbi:MULTISPECIES: hypothetical protein [Cyanophyceae]|uniref:hypothetical protein n=1 Tax=Cyanophyceae TaxID=3028117 RepID=UPI0016861D9C|nr:MULTISPECIES: hypothetical protein [Cyanophyceae]MBD1918927.1 hypothetical protein [Phormidium sp. FACHB-77]MBD2033231.1 hypothetical protein [Phormidium sp. FACHB-322]MBD2053836.1 hypothetical protein [Leptolyngbya sp. FACHB-60]